MPVWGWAVADEEVSVSINGQTKNIKAGADGKWSLKLDALKAGEPTTLVVKGKNTLTIKDVLIGEVWLCSGQSNMGFHVQNADNFEKEKVQKFIKELEQTYKLTYDGPKEKINLKFTAYSKSLKQNLESLFKELNKMDFITSKLMYNDALKLFYIEIRQVQKGHLVFVTDGNENPIRHPIKLSDFQEKPRFYESKEKSEKIGIANGYNIDKSGNPIKNYQGNSKMLIDLLRLLPNYTDKNSFRKKKQMLRRKIKGLRKI